jgi:Na+/H+ antiporter NhaC
VTALVLAAGGRVLDLSQAVGAAIQGMKSMLLAAVILTLAWSIGAVTDLMHTAPYLVDLLGDALEPRLLPVLVFLFSAAASFATGSSWGTMGIVMPLVIPLAHALAPGNEVVLVGTISSVLAGSVWGDHCSPISDTTVLSSMASSSDHMDHVRTQLPYALLVGGVGMLVGDLPTAYGLPWWISWILGTAVLAVLLRTRGRPSTTAS